MIQHMWCVTCLDQSKHNECVWRQAECEWVAQAINKVHVQKAAREEDCWRYIMHWHRLPHVNPEVSCQDWACTICTTPLHPFMVASEK